MTTNYQAALAKMPSDMHAVWEGCHVMWLLVNVGSILIDNDELTADEYLLQAVDDLHEFRLLEMHPRKEKWLLEATDFGRKQLARFGSDCFKKSLDGNGTGRYNIQRGNRRQRKEAP